MRKSLPALLILLCLGILVAGCSDRVQVQIPPKAPVEGIRTIAVLPFDSVASDPGLGFEFEDRIADALRRSGWYDSVVTQRVSSLATGGSSAAQFQTPERARQAGRELNADAVIVGTATYYFEDVFMSVPQCSGCNRPESQPSWSVRQNTNVIVHVTARMIDVRTGRELHARRSVGEDTDYRTSYLNWISRDPVPESLVPKPNRQYIPTTRNMAIERAVRDFTRDLMPTYEWHSVD